MKQLLLFATLFVATVACSQPTYFGSFFTHTVDENNSPNNYTTLDHPDVNGDSSHRIIVTPRYNGVYNLQNFGVWYAPIGKWAIYREDATDTIEWDSQFNVLVPSANGTVLLHKVTSATMSGHQTRLDHPNLNNKPEWVIFATHNWNPNAEATGLYNDHTLGVWYDGVYWNIYNEDIAALDSNMYFNVFIPDSIGGNVFVHTASGQNITNNITYINHPDLNAQPFATIFAMHNYNPVGVPPRYHNHKTGVWYDVFQQRWSVFNQDVMAMDTFSSFNILIAQNGPVGLPDAETTEPKLSFFPNPVKDVLNISYELPNETMSELKIVNSMGQTVAVIHSGRQKPGVYQIPAGLPSLPAGMYYLVLNAEGMRISSGFVKQ